MKLHVLGAGCPAANPDQFGSAFLLEADGRLVLIDCGPATTYKMAKMGLQPQEVSAVFFTHHHFDHNVDFPCFALCRWDMSKGTESPLSVFGPPPTKAFVEGLLGTSGAFCDDWKSRITHSVSIELHRNRGGVLPRPAPAFDVHEVGPGKITSFGSCEVTAVQPYHVEPTLISLAYRFESEEGSVVFCGDCGDSPALREFAFGCDTIVICCTHFSATAYEGIVAGTPQVIGIANETEAKRLVLSHASPGFSNPGWKERAVSEIARSYDGKILFPRELTTIDLDRIEV